MIKHDLTTPSNNQEEEQIKIYMEKIKNNAIDGLAIGIALTDSIEEAYNDNDTTSIIIGDFLVKMNFSDNEYGMKDAAILIMKSNGKKSKEGTIKGIVKFHGKLMITNVKDIENFTHGLISLVEYQLNNAFGSSLDSYFAELIDELEGLTINDEPITTEYIDKKVDGLAKSFQIRSGEVLKAVHTRQEATLYLGEENYMKLNFGHEGKIQIFLSGEYITLSYNDQKERDFLVSEILKTIDDTFYKFFYIIGKSGLGRFGIGRYIDNKINFIKRMKNLKKSKNSSFN